MMNLAEYRRKGTRLADYLPWAALVAPGVVLNKDGSLQRSARFRGPDLDSAVAAELVAVAGRINNAFRRLGSGWAIFVEAQRVVAADYPDSRFPDSASALLDAERRAGFAEQGVHFQSDYLLTFLYLPPPEEAARAETWLYEGRDKTGIDAGEVLRGFIDRTDRVLALFDGIMPECRWMCDGETLTYLHSTISTNSHRVRVPETPAYLDALLADQPLTGGLEPRLGTAHLRLLTLSGFPTATTPGILDDLNRLAFPYRWATRAILMDKTEAARMVARIRRQWFAKRKSIAAILKEVMTNEQSALVDTDAANKAADADMALQELGADIAGEAFVTATLIVWDDDPSRADEKLRLVEKVVQGRDFTAMVETVNAVDAWLGSLPGQAYANVRPAADLHLEPRPYDPALRRLGGGGARYAFRRPATDLRQDRGRDALPSVAPRGRCRPYAGRRADRGGEIRAAGAHGAAVPPLSARPGLRFRFRGLDPRGHARHGWGLA